MEQKLVVVANYLLVQNLGFHCFCTCSVGVNDRVNNDLSHYVSGYGGFGNYGAGLPGGQGGPGSKPGYPIGTGLFAVFFSINTLFSKIE